MVSSGGVNGNNVDGTEGSYCNWQVVGVEPWNNRTLVNWQTGWRFSTTGCRGLRLGSASLDGQQVYLNNAGGDGVHGFVSGHNHRPALEVASGQVWINHDANGNKTFNVSCGMTGFSGLTSNGSADFALDKINQAAAPPSGASASRVSDSQINVAWTNNSTGIAPYVGIRIERSVDGGAFTFRTDLGVVTSFSDGSVSGNHKYRYRVFAYGADGGTSGSTESGDAWTTPGAPTGCTAVRLSGGDIRVTWNNNVNYGEYTTRIEHSVNEGASWAEITSVGAGVSSYDHPNPTSADSHKYRVRSRTSAGPTLNSAYSTQSGIIFANAAPPSACTAVRVSDTQATVAWTNNSTSEAPYKNIKVYRRTNGGGYALIATIGVLTSYTDLTIVANNKYEYRVSAIGQNDVETTFANAAAPVFTTPAANTLMTAAKVAGGNIDITWTVNSNYKGVADLQHDLYDSPDGVVWNYLTTVFGATATYTHVAPNAGITHRYRTVTFPPGTSLFATSAASNIVVLLTTANPPSGLAPAGVAQDAAEAIVFTWVHNPGDGTPQSKYQLQYKIGAGAFTTVGPTNSNVSSFTLPAATLTNGQTITWHVATAGENGTIGAYSADAVFTTSARPTSTISTPSGGVFNNSHLTAEWTYFQAAASPQASWHAFLYRDNLDSTYTLLEEKTGTNENTTSFVTTLLDGLTYAVRVYVTSTAGLTSIDSGTELETFLVTYLPPAPVTITTIYDPDKGQMVLTIVGTSPSPGVTVDISKIDLQRQINGGDWITWVKDLTMPVGQLTAVVVDTMPTIHGINNYRAVIKSDLPSSALSSEVENVTTEPRWGFLSTGASFSQFIKVRAELDRRAQLSRDKATHHFAGRSDPIELSGEQTDVRLNVTGTLFGQSSTPEEMEELALTTGIVLWRDYTGRRVFASLSPVGVDYNTESPLVPISFSLTRVGYKENLD